MIGNMMLMKTLSVFMAVALLVWTSQDAFAAPPPNNINVTFNARVTVKVVKTGPAAIKPIAIYVNGKRFPAVMKNGQWGIQTTYRNLMTVSPLFKQEFDKKIGETLGQRFTELATSGKGGLMAGKTPTENKQRVAAEATSLKTQFTSEYAKLQESTVAAFPRFDNRLTGAAEGAQESGASSDGGAVGEEAGGGSGEGSGSDPGGSFLLFLGMLVLAVTAFVVPLLAIAWLASTGLTLASFTAALTGTVLAASTGVVFNAAMKNIATGEPMWGSYYFTSFNGSPGGLGGSSTP
jgi:hypothetical protein